MEKATQKGRLLSIMTGLGEDYFLLDKLAVSEGISQQYSIDVALLYDDRMSASNQKATVPDIQAVLGQPATIAVIQEDGGERFFNGIFRSFRLTGRDSYFSFYEANIVPQVWELTQIVQSRIFQQKSVPDILTEVFAGYQIKQEYKNRGDYKPRNYCVQYNETDFDFASRLMEEEGICYYFEFSSTAETMIITDNFQNPRDCPKKSTLGIHNIDIFNEVFESSVKSWLVDYQLQTGKFTLWDHNFQLPDKKLEAQKITTKRVGGNDKMEVYQFPGGYSRKYDGISKSGSEQASDLQNIFRDNERTVINRIESLDAEYLIFTSSSDCSTLTAGHRFQLKNHPNADYNGKYIILSANHYAEQVPAYISIDEEKGAPYSNQFTCISHGEKQPGFRPRLKTPKPIIHGSQTAMVVGPSGEEIFTDKYGRVKVQFHWDRYGKVDSDSSCWVRVAQTWAGNKWGAMFIPRIGMEVLVHFLEGDPDQPIITGCVYNAAAMPPYTLPDEKTKSTLKTNSSKGGGGFNEFRIEDKTGEEQIFIHGQKNLDIRILKDAKELIKQDRHLIVERDQFEKVKKDKHLKVTGNQNEQIDGAFSKKVGTNIQEKAGTKFAVDAGTEIHLKAGMSATIEAGSMLTLKVGGNSVTINSGGVFITGQPFVNINSASVSGSGSGCSPDPPKDPLEADTANPGERVKPMKAPPPTTPRTRSAKSAAMQIAAQNATPFVSAAAPPPPAPNKKKDLENAVSELGKEAKKTIAQVEKKALQTLSEIGKEANKSVTQLGKKVSEAVSEVQAKQKEVENKFNQAVNTVKKTVNEGVSELKKVADQGKQALKKVNDEAKEKLKQVEEKIDKGKEALQEGQQKAAEMKKEAQEKVAEVKQQAQEKAAQVQQQAQEKFGEAQKAVGEKVADAQKAVDEKAAEAQKALGEKKAEIAQGLEDLKKKFNPF